MAKFHFYRSRVANMLEKLWFVSHKFTSNEYEWFVAATHNYFSYVSGTSLNYSERLSYDRLVKLVEKYIDDLKEYNINTKFYSEEL